uniref:Ig-like domain-containing protein n=1 Tax=Periophthalmus magnuspinnatus TaxID=409849 RepID=A0A3B4A016_9GOBI
ELYLCFSQSLLFPPFISSIKQTCKSDQIPVTVVQPGDTVTFTCYSEYERVTWYKQTPGHMMQRIASAYDKDVTENESFKNQHFNFTTENTKYVFTIRNIRKEDEAIYHCMLSAGYGHTFMNGTFLVVNSKEDSQSCVHVTQSPSSASVVPGGSVSLQCSLHSTLQCPSKRNVHWFRSGAGESPGSIIYTYEEQTEEQNQRRCVYSLSTTIQDVNDTGTYYCAVATCGHVLFGPGTRVEISSYVIKCIIFHHTYFISPSIDECIGLLTLVAVGYSYSSFAQHCVTSRLALTLVNVLIDEYFVPIIVRIPVIFLCVSMPSPPSPLCLYFWSWGQSVAPPSPMVTTHYSPAAHLQSSFNLWTTKTLLIFSPTARSSVYSTQPLHFL